MQNNKRKMIGKTLSRNRSSNFMRKRKRNRKRIRIRKRGQKRKGKEVKKTIDLKTKYKEDYCITLSRSITV